MIKPTQNTPPYTRLNGIGTRECAPWREAILVKHWPIMGLLVNRYKNIAEQAAPALPAPAALERPCSSQGYIVANDWLRAVHERLRLGQTPLWLHSDDGQLKRYCEAKAKAWAREVHELYQSLGNGDLVLAAIKKQVEQTGLTFPALPTIPEHATKEAKAGALARVIDDQWLRRQLRVKQGRELETLLRELGAVSKHKGIYVSDFSFKRRGEQKRRNQRLMESLEAENEEGQRYTLAELAELSTSNPINRRHELMTRIRGFEEFANQSEDNWQAVLFTVTCPSKYHAVLAKSGQPNPKFNQTTPAQANEYLNTLWKRTRALWHREGIQPFGFRVAEPHHDGCPHWHLLLWFKPEHLKRAERLFKHHALVDDGDERGAAETRFQTVVIDPAKGSAVGYIAKYISKNIDGFGIETDLYGKDAVNSALRIEAWASLWGIRQFQQIGGPSVTVWRELRRLDAEHVEQELLKRLTEAADSGNWSFYTELMGGATCPRNERPARPYMLIKEGMNKYAEQIKVIKGIWMGPLTITTRLHEWVVKAIQEPAANEEQAIASVGASTTFTSTQAANNDEAIAPVSQPASFDAALAVNDSDPWTCVNNCNSNGCDEEDYNSEYDEYLNSMPPPIPIGST